MTHGVPASIRAIAENPPHVRDGVGGGDALITRRDGAASGA